MFKYKHYILNIKKQQLIAYYFTAEIQTTKLKIIINKNKSTTCCTETCTRYEEHIHSLVLTIWTTHLHTLPLQKSEDASVPMWCWHLALIRNRVCAVVNREPKSALYSEVKPWYQGPAHIHASQIASTKLL